MSIKDKIFKSSPYIVQNLIVTAYNTYQYRVRHGGDYSRHRDYYAHADTLTAEQLRIEFEKRKNQFLQYAKNHSKWYKDFNFNNFESVRVLEKKDIVANLDKIATVKEKDGIVNQTGGTTGASMKTIYAVRDMQERFAILDHFRSQHGYELGRKTAWFSGRDLITKEALAKGHCSHYNYIHKIRYYSTFNISDKNFDLYWKSLIKFEPEFIVGFPSSVYEICKLADNRGLKLKHSVTAFFATSENLLPHQRELIHKVMGCKLVDQYSSSEGAPFILECVKGSLHIHPLTGIFEVVDESMQPATEGEILVTSFTTTGTPLIRYRQGDKIKLATNQNKCACGSIFPLVESIEGRTGDTIYSPENGHIVLANLTNCSRGVKGLTSFQIIQKIENAIVVKFVTTDAFTKSEEDKFISALRVRVGQSMNIDIEYVDHIPRESSGKFKIVKNLLDK